MLESIAPMNSDHALVSVIAAVPFIKDRKLNVSANRGRVTIQGRVDSFYEKQIAQETLRGVEGVERINNELVVD